MKVILLARLEGIPLFGGIVALIQLELVIVLARAVAVRFLTNLRAFALILVVVPAMGHLGYIEYLGIGTVILFGVLKEGTSHKTKQFVAIRYSYRFISTKRFRRNYPILKR